MPHKGIILMFTNQTVIIPILIGLIVLMIIWLARTEWRLRRLMRGKSGNDLEGTIREIEKHINGLDSSRKDIENYLTNVEKRLKHGGRSVGVVRFNPFKDAGGSGNQSFAVALLNEEEDGVVFSSLYSRDRVSVFAKPIVAGKSENELTEEEKTAMEKARASARKN
ncbi:MAG: hypothetical protein LiPW30_419 [Parcubacteria group bacterium LiPW_30]|nr:MAG: hypothetical protein LiPW30_419 [Parcubacteria group bacterium LiPW_30]